MGWVFQTKNQKQKQRTQQVLSLLVGFIGLLALLPALAIYQSSAELFADAGLEAAVRKNLEKPKGAIARTELRQITHLDASAQHIQSLEGIERLRRLTSLNLQDNQVQHLQPLSKLDQLTEINLRNNGINCLKEVGLGLLSGLNLRHLNLRENQITDLSPIAGLTHLNYLNLHSNEGIQSIQYLSGLIQLETLILTGVPVGNEIHHLSNLENLQRVNLRRVEVTNIPLLTKLLFNEEALDRAFTDTGIPPVRINEAMASNGTVLATSNGNFEDWIELYNYGKSPVNIGGWGLSDRHGDPFKWTFPDGTILNPGQHMIVWASGKNIQDHELHTNFSLSRKGEEILLTTADGFLVDEFPPLKMPRDISVGRVKGAGGRWFYFDEPSPGIANTGTAYQEILEPVQFSHPGGFYTDDFYLTLSHPDPDITILYTLDGSEPLFETLDAGCIYRQSFHFKDRIYVGSRDGDPNMFSSIRTAAILPEWLPDWQAPLQEVFKATVVRAKGYKPGALTSLPASASYFVGDNIHDRYATLPVISLMADYRDLFDPDSGIYVPGNDPQEEADQNFMHDWRVPAHLEFFDVERTSGFKGNYEIRIQGATSRNSPQKGLHVTARPALEENLIQYPIFHPADTRAAKLDSYKRFIIRAWGSAISWPVFFSDAHNQTLAAQTDLDIQAYRPAIVFINGEYWGLHELREANKNSWNYQFHYGIDRSKPGFDILYGGGARVNEGDAEHWKKMIQWINRKDPSEAYFLEHVSSLMDVDNFIKYIIHCTYLGKRDWPGQNEAKFRPRSPDGKWRWIQFDMDQGFIQWSGPEFDMIDHVLQGSEYGGNPPHRLFKVLIRNEGFLQRFLNTYADWMNTQFSTKVELQHFYRMASELEPYIAEHQARWPIIYNWERGLQTGHEVILRRRSLREQQLLHNFDLPGLATVELHVSDQQQGVLRLNTLLIDSALAGLSVSEDAYPWAGTYFQGVPIELEALPKPGYHFVGWKIMPDAMEQEYTNNLCEPTYYSTEKLISLTPSEDIFIKAFFERVLLSEQ